MYLFLLFLITWLILIILPFRNVNPQMITEYTQNEETRLIAKMTK